MKSVLVCVPLLISAAGHASPWNLDELSRLPAYREDPARGSGEVRAIFYDGLPWKGKPTKVFAYYGIPPAPGGGKVPAMVLVHGGGGSAFIPWVKLWMDRGYAAIAMDTCGAISSGGHNNHARHEEGGPPGWGGFDQIEEPPGDQWTYHAVADVILAHSWIRAQAGVDPEKTGVTGISWGGYLTCVVSGVDPRFKFAAPVYGCGFLTDNSAWLGAFEKMGPANKEKWRLNWDPSAYLAHARMPMLWVTGTNDFAFPMDSLKRSYACPSGERYLAIRPRMPHGHGGAGENPVEIHAMADAILKNGDPLRQVTLVSRTKGEVTASYTGGGENVTATLNYTMDSGVWQKRLWKELPAEVRDGRISATLPEGTTTYYFNLQDAAGRIASSPHEDAPPG